MNTTMNATMNTANMEGEKKMVRKAETLKSLDELNLSEKTLEYIQQRNLPIDTIIAHCRFLVYGGFEKGEGSFWADTTLKLKEYSIETTRALDRAGFINHILNPGTTRLFDFVYSTIYGKDWHRGHQGFRVGMPSRVGLNLNIYESVVTEEFYEKIKGLIEDTLGSEAVEKLMLEKGSNKGEYARLFKKNLGHTNYNWLPDLGPYPAPEEKNPDAEDGQPPKFALGLIPEEDIDSLTNHLESIKKLKATPYFELISKLMEVKHISECVAKECLESLGDYDDIREFASYSEKHGFGLPAMVTEACEYYSALLDHENAVSAKLQEQHAILDTATTELCLGSRTIDTLRRSGISTIGDVLKKADKDLFRVRGFGPKTADDLVAKMHAAGFTDFDI